MEELGTRLMPCSCRRGDMDKEYGVNVRIFDQVWAKDMRDGYAWRCRGCGKGKMGWEHEREWSVRY
jgi:hypothetical protein